MSEAGPMHSARRVANYQRQRGTRGSGPTALCNGFTAKLTGPQRRRVFKKLYRQLAKETRP